MMGLWRKLRNEDLPGMYSSASGNYNDQFKKGKTAGA
jgi:hypothetical protein